MYQELLNGLQWKSAHGFHLDHRQKLINGFENQLVILTLLTRILYYYSANYYNFW